MGACLHGSAHILDRKVWVLSDTSLFRLCFAWGEWMLGFFALKPASGDVDGGGHDLLTTAVRLLIQGNQEILL